MAQYVFQEFPKWKFHPSRDPVVVETAEQETALGRDWFDRPDLAKAELARVQAELQRKKAMNDRQ